MSVEQIKAEREVKEAKASQIAAMLPSGDYYADGNDCVDRISGIRVNCDSHWDACLVMMATTKI